MASKKEEVKPAESAPATEEAPKKKLPVKVIGIALFVVILEVATVGGTMMMSGGPKRAQGADMPVTTQKAVVEKDVEVPIIEAKLPNAQRGKLYLYDLQVVAKVSEKNKTAVTELLNERASEVKDRIRTIVASSDPASLSEPGLETLRRQINYQLEQDLGKDMIKELLIPKCTPFRAEF